jgi:hypothetical protein
MVETIGGLSSLGVEIMATTNKTSTSAHQNRTSNQNRSTHHSRSEESRSRATSMNETMKPVSELLDVAMDSYEKAFRTGLKLQEESGKWWTAFLEQTGPSREWQRTIRTMAGELLPEAQRRVEDGLRMVEQNSRASLEYLRLFKRAVEVPQGNPIFEGQNKLLSFWEESLNSVRDSAQAIAQANTQAMESWMELFRKGTEMAAERARAN